VAAAVGMSVGFGFYVPAIITTVLVLCMLVLLRPIEARIFRRTKEKEKEESAEITLP
jgi:putative Mg2+ transporter-C (MgtC) family protein